MPVPEPAPVPIPVPAPPEPAPAPEPPVSAPAPTGRPPIALAGGYAETHLSGSRGDPLYWSRDYALEYNGGVIRIRARPSLKGEAAAYPEDLPPEEILIWQVSDMVTQQHQDAATFSAPTTDGRQAWLTVHRNGAVIGGGYHGTTPDSYLKLGDPQRDAPDAPVEVRALDCQSIASPDYPELPMPHRIQVRLDRTAFPWSSVAVEGAAVGIRTDPDGGLTRGGSLGNRSISLDGEVVHVTLGFAYYDNLTTYSLRRGSVVEISHQSRFVHTTCR